MIFKTRDDGLIECNDWCDLEDDETCIGLIIKSPEDGYYRLKVTASKPLSCRHLKLTAQKVSEMNKAI
jgi:hypothetical protein